MIDFTFGGLLRSSGSRTRQFVRLRLEALEDRFTPAYFTVTTVGDEPDSNPGDGIASIGDEMQNCTLRAAIQEANAFAGDDTILFGLTDPSDPENPSWTISIRSTLEITSSIGILSPYPEEIWVRRDATAGRFRVFDIAATGSAYMSGITIVNGDVSGHGGGVLSRGGLTMENCAVIANSADEGGGGISSSGHLSVQTSTVAYNDVPVGAIAGPSGGGIELTDGTAAIRYVDISYNEAQEWGGGLYVGEKADAYLEGVGVSWNGAGNSGGGIMAEGPLYMVEGQIFGNSAKGDGGGLWCGKSGVTYSLDGVEIRSNDAGSRGGGYM